MVILYLIAAFLIVGAVVGWVEAMWLAAGEFGRAGGLERVSLIDVVQRYGLYPVAKSDAEATGG